MGTAFKVEALLGHCVANEVADDVSQSRPETFDHLFERLSSIHVKGSAVCHSSQSGLTLLEIVVAIGLVLVLAFLLLPIYSLSKTSHGLIGCAINLRQIAAACEAYRASENISWPVPWTNMSPSIAPQFYSSSNADVVTFQIFQVLAAATNLKADIFKCPSVNIGPTINPVMPDTTNAWLTTNGTVSPTIRIPYALDWAAPGDSGSDRVILADRDPRNHKGVFAMAAYADSHTQKLNKFCAMAGERQTMGQSRNEPVAIGLGVMNFAATTKGVGVKPENVPTMDNIYDDNNDYPIGYTTPAGGVAESLIVGGGDLHRVWVK